MENIPQWVFVLLGAMRIRAVTVPLATTLPESSIRLIAEHAGCSVIFADEPNWEKATELGQQLGCPVLRPSGGSGTLAAEPPGGGDDTALLIYTSGTTGNPKGVELTFDNLAYEIRGAVEALDLNPAHRILSVLPFSHVLPLIANALGPLYIGACVTFLSSISPQRIIEAFHRPPDYVFYLRSAIFLRASQTDRHPGRFAIACRENRLQGCESVRTPHSSTGYAPETVRENPSDNRARPAAARQRRVTTSIRK